MREVICASDYAFALLEAYSEHWDAFGGPYEAALGDLCEMLGARYGGAR